MPACSHAAPARALSAHLKLRDKTWLKLNVGPPAHATQPHAQPRCCREERAARQSHTAASTRGAPQGLKLRSLRLSATRSTRRRKLLNSRVLSGKRTWSISARAAPGGHETTRDAHGGRNGLPASHRALRARDEDGARAPVARKLMRSRSAHSSSGGWQKGATSPTDKLRPPAGPPSPPPTPPPPPPRPMPGRPPAPMLCRASAAALPLLPPVVEAER